MNRLLAIFITAIFVCGCGPVEFMGNRLPGAYGNPPSSAHDVYKLNFVGCDRVSWTLVAVEVPFSAHTQGSVWYTVPIDVDLTGFCY